MMGSVTVLEPRAYEQWLEGRGVERRSAQLSGEALFEDKICNTCHRPDSVVQGPNLEGIYGHEVRLEGGESVVVDDNYLRESILDPGAKLVEGYRAVMPTYQGQLSEEELLELIRYVKSLTPGAGEGNANGESK